MEEQTNFRMLYESLMCTAFKCKNRREFYFVDADIYNNVQTHIGETYAYMLCAIIKLSQEQTTKKDYLTKLAQEMNNWDTPTVEQLDKVLLQLSDNKVIF